ncbi:hypothetical protein [Roseibium denhamense]|nr:hypothetical protein [Roseibium denhamense]
MMIEPRSTATIRALASLAEISADQLEEGGSVEDVIATLRRAAQAVRIVVDNDADAPSDEEDLAQDLTPMDLSVEEADRASDNEDKKSSETGEVHVLNAG